MVSSTVGMGLEELLAALARMRRDHADDPEYQEARTMLPADWPM